MKNGCATIMLIFVGSVCVFTVLAAGFADNKTAIAILIGVHVVAFVSAFIMESFFASTGWKWGVVFSVPVICLCVGLALSLLAEGRTGGWVWLAVGSSLTLVSCFGGYTKKWFFTKKEK